MLSHRTSTTSNGIPVVDLHHSRFVLFEQRFHSVRLFSILICLVPYEAILVRMIMHLLAISMGAIARFGVVLISIITPPTNEPASGIMAALLKLLQVLAEFSGPEWQNQL